MNGTDEARLAERLIEARQTGLRLTLAETGPGPADAAAAYRVQARVAAVAGPVAAWKTGRKSVGGEQIMAPVFTVLPHPAVFRGGGTGPVGIELEIAFLVEAPLPPPETPDFDRQALRCVATLAAIELVDTRLADHEAAGPYLKLADNQINAALVVGAPCRDLRALDLARVDAGLRFGDTTVLQGQCEVPGGDAFATFCAFARMVGGHCGGLRPGHYVTTGSLNGMPFVERGTKIRGHIAGLGEVAVDLAP